MEQEEEDAPCCCVVDEDEYEVCVGRLCFPRPYCLYVPPIEYKRVPGRQFRWKLGVKAIASHGLHVKVQRVFSFPNCLGLNDDARWRWQWYPLSFVLGMKLDMPVQFVSSRESRWRMNFQPAEDTRTTAYVRLKAMTLLCGKLALRPVVEFLPVPRISVRRKFHVGSAQVTLSGAVQLDGSTGIIKGPMWTMKINWQTANSARILVQRVADALTIRYSKKFNVSEACQGTVTGLAECPSNVLSGGLERLESSLPVRLKLDSFKVSRIFGTRARRHKLPPQSAFLKASTAIGRSDLISIVPGHWIDPGYEPGASGEREFNLEIANILEKQLRGNGWKVLRPDRDAPNISWEEYLNWVSRQSLKGTPVLEIHGQGSAADYRGLVLGVIGDADAPLSQELAKDFGLFEMDWTDLAIPRRGGVILESFNADEVLQMAPWHRTWAVRRLANRITSCIERASYKNRAARGIYVNLEEEEEGNVP